MKVLTHKAKLFVAEIGAVILLFVIGFCVFSIGAVMVFADVGDCVGGAGTGGQGFCIPTDEDCGPLNTCVKETTNVCGMAADKSHKIFTATVPGECTFQNMNEPYSCIDCDQLVCGWGFRYSNTTCGQTVYCSFSRLIDDRCMPGFVQ